MGKKVTRLLFSLLLKCAKDLQFSPVSELGISYRHTWNFCVSCICNDFFIVHKGHPTAIMSAVTSIILSP